MASKTGKNEAFEVTVKDMNKKKSAQREDENKKIKGGREMQRHHFNIYVMPEILKKRII